MLIVLPWPANALSPNARPHWRKLHRASADARRDACFAAIDAMNRCHWQTVDRAKTKITFFHKPDSPKKPQYRDRDGDNHLRMLKPTFDGFADARVIVNDSGFRHEPIEFKPDKNRRVEIEIIPLDGGVR
jgi:Holliday junction resolvase RusA-like endonuclease